MVQSSVTQRQKVGKAVLNMSFTWDNTKLNEQVPSRSKFLKTVCTFPTR